MDNHSTVVNKVCEMKAELAFVYTKALQPTKSRQSLDYNSTMDLVRL